jgi:peptidoglycan L-alanyl-D-glutamate endopeptidase CwlK
MYKLSKRSSGRLKKVHPILVDIFTNGLSNCPFDYGIPNYGGGRSKADQANLYAIGRTIKGTKITWTLNSRHLINKETGYGHAVDIYAYVNGAASWSLKYLEPIARHLQTYAMETHGLQLDWGQDLWGKDGAHFQCDTDNLINAT